MSEEEEDFVDFDEEEHAEDVDQQARRLGDLKAAEHTSSSISATQTGASNETSAVKPAAKPLNAKAFAFVPQSGATVPVTRGAGAGPFQKRPSAPTSSHSVVPLPAIQQPPPPGWEPDFDSSMDPSQWQGYWPGGYSGWPGAAGIAPWQASAGGFPPPMGWSAPSQLPMSSKIVEGDDLQPMGKKKGWSKFVAADQQQAQTSQGEVAVQQAKRVKVMGAASTPAAVSSGTPSATSSVVNNLPQTVSLQLSGQHHEMDATLVISRIPPSLNHMLKIASYFSRFGEVKAVQVDTVKGKAIVEFTNPASALRAFNNPHPVFNNSFILVERLKDHKDDGLPSTPAQAVTTNISEETSVGPTEVATHGAPAKHGEGATTVSTDMKKMSYRAPATVLAAASSASAVGLYDNLESARQPDSKLQHTKEIQKAAVKVLLQERQYELTRTKLTALADKMKGVRQKLDELAKQGKNVDATAKAEVLAHMTSLASDIKNAQAAVKAAESKLQEARKEQSDILVSISEDKTKPVSAIVIKEEVMPPAAEPGDPATKVKEDQKPIMPIATGNVLTISTVGPMGEGSSNPSLVQHAEPLKTEDAPIVSSSSTKTPDVESEAMNMKEAVSTIDSSS